MSESNATLVKLIEPQPTHYSADPDNAMGWTLQDVKARWPKVCAIIPEPLPLATHGAIVGR